MLLKANLYFLGFCYFLSIELILLPKSCALLTGELRHLHLKLNQESADAVDCRAQAVACIARLDRDLEKTTEELEKAKEKLKASQLSIMSKDAALKDVKTECTVEYRYIYMIPRVCMCGR